MPGTSIRVATDLSRSSDRSVRGKSGCRRGDRVSAGPALQSAAAFLFCQARRQRGERCVRSQATWSCPHCPKLESKCGTRCAPPSAGHALAAPASQWIMANCRLQVNMNPRSSRFYYASQSEALLGAGSRSRGGSQTRPRRTHLVRAISESLRLGILECEMLAGELEALEIANDTCGNAFRLKEFLGDFLNVFRCHFLEQRNQFGWREVAVEIHVIASQAVHSLPGALGSKQRGAFQMVLGAAQFLFWKRLILDSAEFIEHRANHFRNVLERCTCIHRKRSGIAIRIHLAENRIRQALLFADILEQA